MLTVLPDDCSCSKCQSACQHKPGWFTPDQIEPLANALSLTPEELFKQHLSVDWWERSSEETDLFVLSPRLKHDSGGEMFPSDPSGECHWFQDGKCVIHGRGKPLECQQLGHAPDGSQVGADYEAIAMTWNTPQSQQMIATLLGREPEAPENDNYWGSLFGIW